MELLPTTKFDLDITETVPTVPELNSRTSSAAIALELGGLAMKFSQVERVPRYHESHRENDAEHSFMLALVANELAALLYPELNVGKVSQYAIVHDLIETVTGDVATFKFSSKQMAEKQQHEHAALQSLLDTLPSRTAQLLYEYEQQHTKEARFVKAVDKLLPVVVDIIGPGKKVMEEDYGVTTVEGLARSQAKLHNRIAQSFEEFPSIVTAHELLCSLFQAEFESELLA